MLSLRRAVRRPLTGALHSLVPAAGASRTAGARRALTLARRVAAPTPLRATARRTLALARPTEDADSVQFPREGPGLDYALNWSLCGDGVVPSKLAYRITKVQTAEQLLGGPPEAPAGAGSAAAVVDDDDAFDDAFDDGVRASHPSRFRVSSRPRRRPHRTRPRFGSIRFGFGVGFDSFPETDEHDGDARARRSVGVHARRGRRG